ncbi:hypothetical protein C5L39_00790 [Corynebacterium alimapuense]|uniref:Uncharacterized protein n=2 Tax=Corynebacterium alimapuense TaxID=1576874 RepID=A0A3M8KAX6_9CORY|nr:hypothetical protein C5L39_00790 [Corynebacterium alimapuense]
MVLALSETIAMNNLQLTQTSSDLIASLQSLNVVEPALAHLAPTSLTAAALARANLFWRHQHRQSMQSVTAHLSQVQRFAEHIQEIDLDVHRRLESNS